MERSRTKRTVYVGKWLWRGAPVETALSPACEHVPVDARGSVHGGACAPVAVYSCGSDVGAGPCVALGLRSVLVCGFPMHRSGEGHPMMAAFSGGVRRQPLPPCPSLHLYARRVVRRGGGGDPSRGLHSLWRNCGGPDSSRPGHMWVASQRESCPCVGLPFDPLAPPLPPPPPKRGFWQ